MQVSLYEFLEKVSKLKSNKLKVEALKYNDSKPLRVILKGVFDPSIKWALPEGDPPYQPNKTLDQEGVLLRTIIKNKLSYFVEGVYPGLKQAKREEMFVNLLETVDKNDALLLIAMKDKKLPFSKPLQGISEAVVKEAFPDL
jgi:hypothetical protein